MNETNWNLLTLTPGEDRKLWIYGFVWFTDIFSPKRVRKYGWARQYDPILSKRSGEFRFAHIRKPKCYYAE